MSSLLLRRTRGVQRLRVCRRPGEHEAAAGGEESNVGDEKRLPAATKCSESKESSVLVRGARSRIYFKKSLKRNGSIVSAELLHVCIVTYKQIHIRSPSAI